MNLARVKYLGDLRLTAIRVIAAFFVIYALADVSVLQAYCGNETLGIPPADHVASTEGAQNDGNVILVVGQDKTSDRRVSSSTAGTEKPCEGDEECFGSCSHIVVPVSFVSFNDVPDLPSREVVLPFADRYVQSDLTSPFQPPKQS